MVYIAGMIISTKVSVPGLNIFFTSLGRIGPALALSLLAAPAIAGPSMSTSLKTTTLALAECVKHGEEIMRGAGLTRNLQAHQATVYGEQGAYTASIRCVPGRDIVFFVVAGPRSDRASKVMNNLHDKF